jgi:hypothetical protein
MSTGSEYRAEIIEPKIIDLRAKSVVFDFGKYEGIIKNLKNLKN